MDKMMIDVPMMMTIILRLNFNAKARKRVIFTLIISELLAWLSLEVHASCKPLRLWAPPE